MKYSNSIILLFAFCSSFAYSQGNFLERLRKMKTLDLKTSEIGFSTGLLAYECLSSPQDPPRDSSEPERILFFTHFLVPGGEEFRNFVMTGSILFESKPVFTTESGPEMLPAKFHFRVDEAANVSILEQVETLNGVRDVVKVPLGAYQGGEREKRAFTWKKRPTGPALHYECRTVASGEMHIYLR